MADLLSWSPNRVDAGVMFVRHLHREIAGGKVVCRGRMITSAMRVVVETMRPLRTGRDLVLAMITVRDV